MNDLRKQRLALIDEISSLEMLADMAADLEQMGRVRYCRTRAKKLRADLIVVNAQIAEDEQDAKDAIEDDRVLRTDVEMRR